MKTSLTHIKSLITMGLEEHSSRKTFNGLIIEGIESGYHKSYHINELNLGVEIYESYPIKPLINNMNELELNSLFPTREEQTAPENFPHSPCVRRCQNIRIADRDMCNVEYITNRIQDEIIKFIAVCYMNRTTINLHDIVYELNGLGFNNQLFNIGLKLPDDTVVAIYLFGANGIHFNSELREAILYSIKVQIEQVRLTLGQANDNIVWNFQDIDIERLFGNNEFQAIPDYLIDVISHNFMYRHIPNDEGFITSQVDSTLYRGLVTISIVTPHDVIRFIVTLDRSAIDTLADMELGLYDVASKVKEAIYYKLANNHLLGVQPF